MTRLIKRYGNRKLYDTKASCYITLDGIAALVRQGEDVRVIDNDSGEELTALIFAQIILEEEKKKTGLLSLPALRWIIREGEARLHELRDRMDKGREAIDTVRDFAERSVERLVRAPAEEVGRGLRDMLERPQRQLDAIQSQIDQQVRQSVKRLAGHPTVQNELERIRGSLHRLEQQIGRLQRRTTKPEKRLRRKQG
jgi:polyhydroxyalkanoate synthesis repressor PhaR